MLIGFCVLMIVKCYGIVSVVILKIDGKSSCLTLDLSPWQQPGTGSNPAIFSQGCGEEVNK